MTAENSWEEGGSADLFVERVAVVMAAKAQCSFEIVLKEIILKESVLKEALKRMCCKKIERKPIG